MRESIISFREIVEKACIFCTNCVKNYNNSTTCNIPVIAVYVKQ